MLRFFKITSLFILIFSAAACSGKNKPTAFPVLPNLTLVVTHAIDVPHKFTALVFVPNNVAPWLGRIILLGPAGKLYSTDIEGSGFIAIEGQSYKDIFGLSGENTAGVFMALNQTGKIEAFIEADKNGGFAPLTYSGKELSFDQFCRSSMPSKNRASLLTSDGNIVTVQFALNGEIIEQKIINTLPALKNTALCAVNDNALYAAHKNLKSISWYEEEKWHELKPFSLGKSIGYQTLDEPYFSQILDGKAELRAVSDTAQGYRLDINDGLSIRGIKQASYMAVTSANYGGAAFKDGVFALFDTSENRVVFLSRGYVTNMLGKEKTTAP